ncbi:MAG: sigma-54-dependent Fis family transcriptional regulator [Acidobacteriota bacterium]|nr:sigma-54-dependent Fis family transcriptional regulator [Acidobacteriota bacterium]
MSAPLTNPLFSSALVASPNHEFRRRLLELLRPSHCRVQEARGGAEALAKLDGGEWQALLLDNWLPDLDVDEFLSIVKSRHPNLKVLVIEQKAAASADNETDLSEGIEKILRPPDDLQAETWDGSLSRPAVPAFEPMADPLPGMIGVSHVMQNVYRLSRLVAQRSTTVLLTGETGTGKELVAKAIHSLSPRQRQPFVTVNCAAIPESLLEAELFGYARGAFTGAFQSRAGRIHAAHGGTLFLDEVGELPLSMQAKLLRFLQEGEVQRLGGQDVVRVDVRVIAATNAELSKRVEEKAFREDLYYRVAVFPIDLIPLRSRPEDIPPLSDHFLRAFCQEAGLRPKDVSDDAYKLMERHTWPGNVRELRHVIERAFILSEAGPHILPQHVCLRTSAR